MLEDSLCPFNNSSKFSWDIITKSLLVRSMLYHIAEHALERANDFPSKSIPCHFLIEVSIKLKITSVRKLNNSFNYAVDVIKCFLFFHWASKMCVLFLAFKISNVFQNVSLPLHRRLLSATATTIFIFSQKTVHKWAFLGQRLFCHSVSVILWAAIILRGFRINFGTFHYLFRVSISEWFYLTREIVATQLDTIRLIIS